MVETVKVSTVGTVVTVTFTKTWREDTKVS